MDDDDERGRVTDPSSLWGQIQMFQATMEEDQLALNALHEEALMKLQKELLDR